jgi:hypothetical protein
MLFLYQKKCVVLQVSTIMGSSLLADDLYDPTSPT